MALGDHLTPYLLVLRAAFPTPPSGEERRVLLRVLFADMSEEALASVMAEYLEEEGVVVLNEAIQAANGVKPDPALEAWVRRSLAEQGWHLDVG